MLLPNKRTAVRLLFGSSWPTADRPVLGSIQVKDDMQGDHGSLAPDTMGIAD